MADPIGGGLGKAAQQMMQQVQQQATQTQKVGGQSGGPDTNKFDKMLTQQTQQPQQVQDVSKLQETSKAMDTLRAAKAGVVNPSTQVKTVEGVKDPQKMEGMKKLVATVMDGQEALDKIIAKASSGKQFSNQELLAMQAGVYKFSQELELTSKVIEKGTSGVKQVMQTQV